MKEAEWEKPVRLVIKSELGVIPYVGTALNALVEFFWPPNQDVWEEIAGRVEQVFDKKLNEHITLELKNNLAGLKNVLNDYIKASQNSGGDGSFIIDWYVSALSQFDLLEPNFKSPGYETMLLPLLGPFVDMRLFLLRDGVLFGKSWGMSDQVIAENHARLKAEIQNNSAWVNTWYRDGFTNEVTMQHETYHRQMAVSVLESMEHWPYFDPDFNPGGNESAIPSLKKEVFGEAVGAFLGFSRLVDENFIYIFNTYQWNQQRTRMTGFKIWDVNKAVGTVQIANAGTWGAQFGLPHSGSPSLNHANSIANPIIRVTGTAHKRVTQDIKKQNIYTLILHFADGSQTQVIGEKSGGIPFDISLEGHVVRNLYVDSDMSGLLVGFSYPDAVYDNSAPIVPIEFVNWETVTDKGVPTVSILRRYMDTALKDKKRLVSPSEVLSAWEQANLNIFAYAMLSDGSFALPIQKDTTDGKFKRGANIDIVGGNQGYLCTPLKEVKFFSQANMDRPQVLAKCKANNWRLASVEEAQAAWQYLNLNEFAFGRTWDDRFIIPLQKAQSGITRGINITIPVKKNDGFFYIEGN